MNILKYISNNYTASVEWLSELKNLFKISAQNITCSNQQKYIKTLKQS